MENKTTSSQLPTALRLGNTVTTDKSLIIENFKKHFFFTAVHAFHLATTTPVNSPTPPKADQSEKINSPNQLTIWKQYLSLPKQEFEK
jgi:hypothetical protein